MTKMTSQLAQQGINMGAIYELAFINRWNKPAQAYVLTKAMAEVADYKDRTFHSVVIRETSEVVPTRQFKADWKEKYMPKKEKVYRQRTNGKYEYTSWRRGEPRKYYTITYHLTHTSQDNLRLIVRLITDKDSEVIMNLEGTYSVGNWNMLLIIIEWFKTVRLDFLYMDSVKYKYAVKRYFNIAI